MVSTISTKNVSQTVYTQKTMRARPPYGYGPRPLTPLSHMYVNGPGQLGLLPSLSIRHSHVAPDSIYVEPVAYEASAAHHASGGAARLARDGHATHGLVPAAAFARRAAHSARAAALAAAESPAPSPREGRG